MSPEIVSVRSPDKVLSVIRAGDAGLGEGGHSGMTGEGRAQQQYGDAGAGGFAEPHVEIEQRVEAEFGQQRAVAGFGGDMSGAAVIEDSCDRDGPAERPPRSRQSRRAARGFD